MLLPPVVGCDDAAAAPSESLMVAAGAVVDARLWWGMSGFVVILMEIFAVSDVKIKDITKTRKCCVREEVGRCHEGRNALALEVQARYA